ncbi:hypothetical protein L1277_002206 [Okibacterium sp. HSC-33S16]|uniref:hypothetical protein n=1 Tax=Okibacterium sp. HSC-33S16 TaxID=2910965 RepID=UPI00209E82BA|nr:hypothetical protein [Okibacterium sp. HSC-33S16]MCP2032107.1 hypothetical protein [Okibacterium sp. HSC-33S16]
MVIESQLRIDDAVWRAENPAERESPTHRILLVGDDLACLSSMADFPEVDRVDRVETADNGYAAAVLGIAAPEATDAVAIREHLNSRLDVCLTLAERVPSLNHLILVIGHSSERMPRSAKKALLSVSESLSENIQAEVEQRFGSYVIVTILLAGRCNDSTLLAERLIDRAAQTGVADAASVVLWEEITDDSIGDVGLNQYI